MMRDTPGIFPWPAQNLPTKPIMVDKDGYVTLPDGPGLGIEIDEAYVRKYTQ
jgi:L-alanine-DL-glutamate epimerase-like enolase superfamily enzyme